MKLWRIKHLWQNHMLLCSIWDRTARKEKKLKDFLDNKEIRIFDPVDAEYKNVRITGAEAEKLARELTKVT